MLKARLTTLIAILCVLSFARPALAVISFVDMFRSGFATQTGDTTLSTTQFRFDAHLTSTVQNEFTHAVLTPGAGAPVTLLAPANSTVYSFQSSFFSSQTLMDLAFPTGTYTYVGVGATPDTTSFSYTSDFYPVQPLLIGGDLSALQGLDPTTGFAFDFNPFATNASLTHQFIFFTIFDVTTNTTVVNSGPLDETTLNFFLPSNTLVANHLYRYEIIYSNRLETASPGAIFNATLAWESRTSGTFTTSGAVAVPEPSSIILLLVGAIGLWGVRRNRFR